MNRSILLLIAMLIVLPQQVESSLGKRPSPFFSNQKKQEMAAMLSHPPQVREQAEQFKVKELHDNAMKKWPEKYKEFQEKNAKKLTAKAIAYNRERAEISRFSNVIQELKSLHNMSMPEFIKDGCNAHGLNVYHQIVKARSKKEDEEDKVYSPYKKLIAIKENFQEELESQTEIFTIYDDLIRAIEYKIISKDFDYLQRLSESDKSFDPQDPRAICIQKHCGIPVFKKFIDDQELLLKGNILSQSKLVEFFLNIGVDVNVIGNYSITPLCCAMKMRDIDLVKLLLDHPNINVNFENDNLFWSPLYWAVRFNDAQIVKLLLKHPDINVNIQKRFCRTPLHVAVKFRSIDMVKLLLEDSRVNPNITDLDNHTPLDYVEMDINNGTPSGYVKPGNNEMLQLFREKNINTGRAASFLQMICIAMNVIFNKVFSELYCKSLS